MDPFSRKETNGRIMGYRHRNYWTVYEKSGSKFIYNADFWYALAIYVRRMHEGKVGDDRYPLSLRKSHPVMQTRLTPEQSATMLPDPVPTEDNDGFEGIVEGQEQYPYYNSDPVPYVDDGQPGPSEMPPRPPSRSSTASSASSYNPPIPGSPALSHISQDEVPPDMNLDHTQDRPSSPEAGPSEPQAEQKQGHSKSKKSSSKKTSKKEPDSPWVNFLKGGSGRKRRT
ncbi:hypothetical protein CVT24_004663 [Panaeolus cyanescens]|uniref:Uncharacterized protein n=1 Tax=Panaeolus cyanescens TaxID=181874 RepID=A0A409YSG8_9AGAR|nr:hypothetical protein CVT24_004663 [Panaeolus cyanescens]